jgi:putative Ca2+/H+ antiporter (TMEM165/GDT1 family)
MKRIFVNCNFLKITALLICLDNIICLSMKSNISITIQKENIYQYFNDITENCCKIFSAAFLDRSFLITLVLCIKYHKQWAIIFISVLSTLFTISYINSFNIELGSLFYTKSTNISAYIDVIDVFVFISVGLFMLIDGLKKEQKNEEDKMFEVQREVNKAIFRENEILADINKREGEIVDLTFLKQENVNLTKFFPKWNWDNVKIFSFASSLILLTELGEKSQINTVYISSKSDPIIVFFSIMFVQLILTIISIAIGSFLSNKISDRTLALVSGAMFIYFGLISLYMTCIHDYMLIHNAWKGLNHHYHKQNIKINEIEDKIKNFNYFNFLK